MLFLRGLNLVINHVSSRRNAPESRTRGADITIPLHVQRLQDRTGGESYGGVPCVTHTRMRNKRAHFEIE